MCVCVCLCVSLCVCLFLCLCLCPVSFSVFFFPVSFCLSCFFLCLSVFSLFFCLTLVYLSPSLSPSHYLPDLTAAILGPEQEGQREGKGRLRWQACEGRSSGSLGAWVTAGLQEQGERGGGTEMDAVKRGGPVSSSPPLRVTGQEAGAHTSPLSEGLGDGPPAKESRWRPSLCWTPSLYPPGPGIHSEWEF